VLQARKAKREADAAQEEAATARERADAKDAKLQDDSAAAAEARAAAEAARDDLQVTYWAASTRLRSFIMCGQECDLYTAWKILH
jgi:hypothetical protein